MTVLSLLTDLPPLTWLRDLDEAIDAAWDTSDPLLRGDGPDPARPAAGGHRRHVGVVDDGRR